MNNINILLYIVLIGIFLPLLANIKKSISYLLSSASIKENVKEKVKMLNYLKSNSNRKRSVSCLIM